MIDGHLGLEFVVILALILLNGVFAMSEIAVVASRKARLRRHAAEGRAGARQALELAEHPTRFLSTVQIGITLIGVCAGAFGGASIAGQLDTWLEQYPGLDPYSEELALGAVVLSIAFLSLVVGELVPKRIALHHPERVAATLARPMYLVSRLAGPVVGLLTFATDGILRVMGIRKSDRPPVTQEEVSAMIDLGLESGVFEEEEHDLVERVFWLGDQRLDALMTPRSRVEWLDVDDPPEAYLPKLVRHRFTRYPVCEGGLDQVLGMVRAKDLLAELIQGRSVDLRTTLLQPLMVRGDLPALRLLEMFRETGVHLAVVVDESGGTEGLVTLSDVVEELTGQVPEVSEPALTPREDGSWLADASVGAEEFGASTGWAAWPEGGEQDGLTLGGVVVTGLGRAPRTGDVLRSHGLRFEIVDMDGPRVDKILVSVDEGPGAG